MFFSSPPDSANQNQTVAGNTQFPSQYTVSTAGGGSQTAPSASGSVQSPDVADAFSSLFSQLGVVRVSFNQLDTSSGGDGAAVYALYAKDVAVSKEIYPNEKNYSIHAAFIDLNEDGTNEAIVYGDLPGFCGVVGCPLDIYQKQAGAWGKIFSTVAQGEIGLLNVYVNSYRSLALTLSRRGTQSEVVSYSWDGKMYQPGAVIATWTDAGFVLTQ